MQTLLAVFFSVFLTIANGYRQARSPYVGPFVDKYWRASDSTETLDSQKLSWVVSLSSAHDAMHDRLMDISNPKSQNYGHYMSTEEIIEEFGPNPQDLQDILRWIESNLNQPSSVAEHNIAGDMIIVHSTVGEAESILGASLSFFESTRESVRKVTKNRMHIRATSNLHLPEDLSSKIAFISLNSPINGYIPKSGRLMREDVTNGFHSNKQSQLNILPGTVGAYPGNNRLMSYFYVTCENGALNADSAPCSSQINQPVVTAVSTPVNPNFPPLTTSIQYSTIQCFDNTTDTIGNLPCSSVNCICYTRIGPLEKYMQYTIEVFGSFSGVESSYGTSAGSFVVTDVATPQFLYEIYDIPYGLTVRHGATQAVAEWYDEYYSQSDLSKFLSLAGLRNQTIQLSQVIGPNNQNTPGGEAQLDVEYIMAIAQNASLSFYSIPTYNPYTPINEDFLAWMYIVGNETNPPLVHSLSYGDIEASIFNTSNPGSSEYGDACDDQFMKMGLRGLTVVVASGDDGSSSNLVRDSLEACATSVPNWPATSPYVTTIGATQRSNYYLPACGLTYEGLPIELPLECSDLGETTCTSPNGGVITSGGGFSDVYDRATLAPWQNNAVNEYLMQPGATPTVAGFFNAEGRAYPDVSAYGSNYMVYLNGTLLRESGTSASTPVFGAMVTLWNDMRLSQGMSPMGFIAPFLYQIAAETPEAFYDVTTGNIACAAGRGEVNCCDETFYASPGWDAATGLGSPKYSVIANLVLDIDNEYPGSTTQTAVGPQGQRGEDGEDESEAAAQAGLIVGSIALALVVVLIVHVIIKRKSAAEKENVEDRGIQERFIK